MLGTYLGTLDRQPSQSVGEHLNSASLSQQTEGAMLPPMDPDSLIKLMNAALLRTQLIANVIPRPVQTSQGHSARKGKEPG